VQSGAAAQRKVAAHCAQLRASGVRGRGQNRAQPRHAVQRPRARTPTLLMSASVRRGGAQRLKPAAKRRRAGGDAGVRSRAARPAERRPLRVRRPPRRHQQRQQRRTAREIWPDAGGPTRRTTRRAKLRACRARGRAQAAAARAWLQMRRAMAAAAPPDLNT
jgi:hypothetical protein